MGERAVQKICFLLAVASLTTGCAFTTHQVNLAVNQPATPPATVDAATTLRLRVVDERDQTDLGHRGAGIAAAKVTVDGLIRTFTTAVEDGFRKKGYNLTTDPTNANAELVVSLRALKFEESLGFFTVGAEADAAILAEARRGTEDYRNQYRASDEDRQFAISFGGGIDEQINLVLNKTLAQLFNDRNLDDFLTRK